MPRNSDLSCYCPDCVPTENEGDQDLTLNRKTFQSSAHGKSCNHLECTNRIAKDPCGKIYSTCYS
jgi:hypothetical protein